MAGIVPVPDGYLVVFCSGKGWLWRQRTYDHGLDGSCAIKVMKVARDFDRLPKFDWWENVRHAQGDYPLLTLAEPPVGKSYVRPVVASLSGDQSIVVFEQWGDGGRFRRWLTRGLERCGSTTAARSWRQANCTKA